MVDKGNIDELRKMMIVDGKPMEVRSHNLYNRKFNLVH